MTPKTRLDPLVRIRERSEEGALDNLANAQRSLGRARERLASVRALAARDARGPGAAALWATEEAAHARVLHAIHHAEREVAQARGSEHAARAAYERAWREAEASRRLREKKITAIRMDHERREQWVVDDLATVAFNTRR